MTRTITLVAPSGLSGNLLASAVARLGVPRAMITGLPTQLALTGFTLEEDEHGLLDGHGGDLAVTVDEVADRIARITANDLVASTARAALILATGSEALHGETAADTAFDIAATLYGLAYLGWPRLLIAGPLPRGRAHPIVDDLLVDWDRRQLDVDLELVTPTAAALLHVLADQVSEIPVGQRRRGELLSRFARQADLAPLELYTD